jgi:hypothetical protein
VRIVLPFYFVLRHRSWGQTGAQTVDSARQNYGASSRTLRISTRRDTELSGYSTEGGKFIGVFSEGRGAQAGGSLLRRSGSRDGRILSSPTVVCSLYLRTEVRYGQTLTADLITTSRVKVATREQNRSYFARGKLVRWVDENGKIRPAGQEYTTQERETLAQARLLLSKAIALLD